jgi:hypothetical protein
VLGLEDVTAYFHLGLAASVRPNPLSRRGIATCLPLSRRAPLTVNYIMAVAEIPRNWGRVKNIVRGKDGVTLLSSQGRAVHAAIDAAFLYSEPSAGNAIK